MVRIECEQCHTVGRLQQIGKSYFRIRHYKGINKETNKSEFYYHQQSKEYIAKLNLEHNLIPSNGHSIEHLNTNIEQKLKDSSLFLRNMAGEVGFEPTTPNLGGWCSIRAELLAHAYCQARTILGVFRF